MRRQITLPLALVLLSLSGFAPAARGQLQSPKAAFDTGIINLGPNQILRLTVNGQGGDDAIAVRFRRLGYTWGQYDIATSVRKLTLDDQDQSPVLTLAPGEAASFDIPGTADGVRGMVLSSSQNVRATAQIVDGATGATIEYQLIWVPQGSPAVGKQ
jgi:hypothetical protein